MIHPIPAPTLWDDPGPLPIAKFWRWLWGRVNDGWYFPVREAWVEQWKVYLKRQQELEEEYQMYLDQVAAYEMMLEQYEDQRLHMEDVLPKYLHHLGLSYRRTVQDRKHERPYERVEYCEVVESFFDEHAYYFWLKTWPLPYGVRISHFQPGEDGKNEVADTLSAAFGSRTTIEFNDRNHDRPGLWIVVEHRAGRGAVPMSVSYEKCLAAMPKGAKPLSFPLGHGTHNRAFIVDLGEVTNLLIGGSQGGGKSNGVNVILTTFIKRNGPEDLRLFMADFKRVEFAFYKGIPLLGGDVPYIQKATTDDDGNEKSSGAIKIVPKDYEPKDGEKLHKPLGQNIIIDGPGLIRVLDYALAEIERRTDLLEGKVKKISTWNKRYPHKKLSRWLIVIDELADVMLQPKLKKQIEPTLVRIAQLGRAMGIHLILATQTPKNEVVSLLIQNNIINRIVFRCGTGQASGVMLDGLYDAARLPPVPGRALFREGAKLVEIQMPEITDLTIRSAVKNSKEGKVSDVVSETRAIAADKVFEYALNELDGYCSRRDLYQAFKRQNVPQRDINSILEEYEVAGAPPALEPEIEIGDDLYYLAPSPGGRVPRQLIPEQKFIAEFDEKWSDILAVRGSWFEKSGNQGGGQNGKNSKSAKTQLTQKG